MAATFPMDLTTRSGKGSPLNATEFDQNLQDIEDCTNDLDGRAFTENDSAIYQKKALTGGGATALDSIDGTNLADGDTAIVITSSNVYFYDLDADSGATESSPDVISPDDNAGTKRWILRQAFIPEASTTVEGIVGLATTPQVQAGTDTERAVTPAGVQAYHDVAGGLQPTLIDNALFIAASRSSPAAVGSCLTTNSGFDSDVSGWTACGGATLSYQTVGGRACMRIASTGTSNAGATQAVSVVKDRLYQLSVKIYSGTGSPSAIIFGIQNSSCNTGYAEKNTGAPSASWTTHTIYFVPTISGTMYVSVYEVGLASGEYYHIDDFTLNQMAAGFTGADSYCFDGWSKDTASIAIYREEDEVQDGYLYSAKCVPSAAGKNMYWPSSAVRDTEVHYSQFAGRTVAFGAWVKCSTAAHVRLCAYTDPDMEYSSYHTGGGDWEWLECTMAVGAAATLFQVGWQGAQTSGDYYVCGPMLIYGSHIGEGNFVPRRGERIYLETYIAGDKWYNSTGHSTTSWTTTNLQADTLGKIGRGVKSIRLTWACRDSGSASSATNANIIPGDGNIHRVGTICCSGLANDMYTITHDEIQLGDGETFKLEINASGSGTFDFASFTYGGIVGVL